MYYAFDPFTASSNSSTGQGSTKLSQQTFNPDGSSEITTSLASIELICRGFLSECQPERLVGGRATSVMIARHRR